MRAGVTTTYPGAHTYNSESPCVVLPLWSTRSGTAYNDSSFQANNTDRYTLVTHAGHSGAIQKAEYVLRHHRTCLYASRLPFILPLVLMGTSPDKGPSTCYLAVFEFAVLAFLRVA